MRRAPVIRRAGPEARPPGEEAARGYSPARFAEKLRASAVAAGRAVIERALLLYYAAQRPDVPRWAKLTIWGALAYFILPLDAVPDFLPGAGYVDDLGALGAALLTVASYIDEDVRRRARERLDTLFGAAGPRPGG